MNNDLLQNLDQLHSTDLGIGRIRKNLKLNVGDVVLWCKEKIKSADDIVRKGKNWYVCVDGVQITVNAHSFTIIAAHKGKGRSLPSGIEWISMSKPGSFLIHGDVEYYARNGPRTREKIRNRF